VEVKRIVFGLPMAIAGSHGVLVQNPADHNELMRWVWLMIFGIVLLVDLAMQKRKGQA
jgi:hypothetical protein